MKNNIKIEIIPCLQDNYSYLIIDGNKKDGIDSYLNGIKKLTDILGVSIKDHGKAFCFDPKRINKTLVNDWKNSALSLIHI